MVKRHWAQLFWRILPPVGYEKGHVGPGTPESYSSLLLLLDIDLSYALPIMNLAGYLAPMVSCLSKYFTYKVPTLVVSVLVEMSCVFLSHLLFIMYCVCQEFHSLHAWCLNYEEGSLPWEYESVECGPYIADCHLIHYISVCIHLLCMTYHTLSIPFYTHLSIMHFAWGINSCLI